jgi:hypothetical protein
VLVGAVALLLCAGVAVAVVTDLVGRQERIHRTDADASQLAPGPRGPTFSVAAGVGWELLAWRSDAGICLDYATTDNYSSACGFPVTDNLSQSPSQTHAAVVGLAGPSDLRSGFVAGVGRADVERVDLELTDGTIVAADVYRAPPGLRTRLRFFIAPDVDVARTSPGPPVLAVVAYDKDGRLLERNELALR